MTKKTPVPVTPLTTLDLCDLGPLEAVQAVEANQGADPDALRRLGWYFDRHVVNAVIAGGEGEIVDALLRAIDRDPSDAVQEVVWSTYLSILAQARKVPTLEKGLALVRRDPVAAALLRWVEGHDEPVLVPRADTDRFRRHMAALKALDEAGLVRVWIIGHLLRSVWVMQEPMGRQVRALMDL
jgi:hypothetical protein